MLEIVKKNICAPWGRKKKRKKRKIQGKGVGGLLQQREEKGRHTRPTNCIDPSNVLACWNAIFNDYYLVV